MNIKHEKGPYFCPQSICLKRIVRIKFYNRMGIKAPSRQSVTSRSREFPFPGIVLFFWWYRNRYRKNLVPKKVSEPVSKTFWYRKKSRNRSRKNLVPKSLGISFEKNLVSESVSKEIGTKKSWIFLSQSQEFLIYLPSWTLYIYYRAKTFRIKILRTLVHLGSFFQDFPKPRIYRHPI